MKRVRVLAVVGALMLTQCAKKETSKNIAIDFVKIPGGRFEMGDKWGAGDSDERPVHSVKVKTFFLSRSEITVAQFRRFIETTGYQTDADTTGWGMAWTGEQGGIVRGANWSRPGFSQGDDHPAVMVSWNDAVAFCRYTGTRLPTEAEWEYAARNGKQNTLYPSGDSLTIQDANFRINSAPDPFPFTSPVGRFKPNTFGLVDMAGNASEWCSDWYDPVYYEEKDSSNPRGPSLGQYRVLRGGSFMDNRDFCRSVERNAGLPDDRVFSVGFRVALP